MKWSLWPRALGNPDGKTISASTAPGPFLALALLFVFLNHCEGALHYGKPPCQSDEILAEVQGAPGNLCAPRCEESNYNCAADMPSDASAQPQCMLQDIDQGAYCGLLCQVDAQCPSGAKCRQLKQVDVGLCLFPVAFADWARQASTKKLAIGWPSRKNGQSTANFQISKTYAALQNLKQKYSIDDGDGDMVTLKELLNTLSAPTPAPQAGSITTVGNTAVATIGNGLGSGSQSQPRSEGTVYGTWRHDIATIGNDLSRGLPGIQDGIHDTLYNIEHITQRNAAATLLRGLILICVVYVTLGSFIKYQTTGARGINMIPHIGFWMEYPKLVNDGVLYTRIIVGNAMGMPHTSDNILHSGSSRSGGAGSFEVL